MNEIIQNFKDILTKKYFLFDGRASRKEFWYYVLVNAVIIAILQYGVGLASEKAALVLVGIYSLAVLLPGLGVTVRRLHDIGKSGWAIFISIIPLVGALILLYWEAKAGDTQDNKYGVPPTTT